MNYVAASLAAFCGLGFGIPGLIGIRHFAERGEVWMFMGFPAYGGGPFERWGLPTSITLLAAFFTVCLGELIVAALLWWAPSVGAWVALALLPFEVFFWVGFALPIALIAGAIRTILVVVMLITQ